MDSGQFGSGDSNTAVLATAHIDETQDKRDEVPQHEEDEFENNIRNKVDTSTKVEITPEIINANETRLKERIAECRNIIESLKLELNEEKAKLANRTKNMEDDLQDPCVSYTSRPYDKPYSIDLEEDIPYSPGMYSASVEKKLNYDEGLIQYERQLEKYQNTLNLAQIEKKNAIRKQMLAKAFKLKLMEVENQCNIEMLRVKQSLQCLEPLKMIANKWKESNDNGYDLDNFELIPRYPELNNISGCDLKPLKEEVEGLVTNEKSSTCDKHDFTQN